MNFKSVISIIALISVPALAAESDLAVTEPTTAVAGPADELADSLNIAKDELSKTDEKTRNVMGTLYDINLKMKRMSRRRDILNDRLISVQSNVESLTTSTKALEEMLAGQRSLLSKRLRAMYMIGEEGVVRAIFSSSGSHELDKFLRYLERISKQDYKMIKTYEKNLAALNRRKHALDRELQKLAKLKVSIKSQETALESNQRSKAKLLNSLEVNRSVALGKIKGLRTKAEKLNAAALLEESFFEKKGQLASPVQATVSRGYGLVEVQPYKYRLAHKGYEFATSPGAKVKPVFQGKIAFAGDLDSYGLTVIVDHSDHFYTVYSNLAQVTVQEGDTVTPNQIFASTQKELYFEIRHFSDALDPKQWLQLK